MIDKSTITKLAEDAYRSVYNQSEDRVVSDAFAKFSDQEDQEDYIESYLVIFQQGWVNFMAFRGAFNASLGETDKFSLLQLEDALKDKYQIRIVQNSTVGTSYTYIRPIEGHEEEMIPEEADVEVKIKVPELSESNRKQILSVIKRLIMGAQDNYLLMAKLGPSLDEEIHYKSMGFRRLSDLLDQFQEDIEICEDSNGAKCVRLQNAEHIVILPKENVTPHNTARESQESTILKILGDLSMAEHGTRTGWVNTVKISPVLKSNGIDYKQLGFKKLRQMLESLGERVELNQVSATALFVRLADGSSPVAATVEPVKKSNQSPYEKMIGFAYFPPRDGTNGFTAMLNELEEISLDEKWEFGSQKILQNFFLFTFDRILYEDERATKQGRPKESLKLRKGKRYAIFNTGLVNSYYSQVFALFKSSNSSKTQWLFDGFHTEEERKISIVKKEERWSDLPASARFYDSVEDIVYDITYHVDAVNWEHIIIDNVERIPAVYVRQNSPKSFVVEETPEKPIDYYAKLRAAIKNDDYWYRKMVKLFSDAMDRSIKHVNWNFHYAVPMYYPRRHKVSMLLPLNLGDTRDNKVDLALVLERDASNHSYIATTIMTLEQVYCNVRLITKVDDDSNWLRNTVVDSEDKE